MRRKEGITDRQHLPHSPREREKKIIGNKNKNNTYTKTATQEWKKKKKKKKKSREKQINTKQPNKPK